MKNIKTELTKSSNLSKSYMAIGSDYVDQLTFGDSINTEPVYLIVFDIMYQKITVLLVNIRLELIASSDTFL